MELSLLGSLRYSLDSFFVSPVRSSQRLVMVLWCYTPQTLQFYIRDKMNNQINRSLENASIQFCCKAYHPGVVVSDVFSSELSKKMLWHLMNLDKLNRILQESVSMQDIQNSQVSILALQCGLHCLLDTEAES